MLKAPTRSQKLSSIEHSTWMGDPYKRVNDTKDWLALLLEHVLEKVSKFLGDIDCVSLY
jgi:hypothetical protein